MSTNPKEGQTTAVDQPAKGIGCKLPPDTYKGIAKGLALSCYFTHLARTDMLGRKRGLTALHCQVQS